MTPGPDSTEKEIIDTACDVAGAAAGTATALAGGPVAAAAPFVGIGVKKGCEALAEAALEHEPDGDTGPDSGSISEIGRHPNP